MDRPAGWIAPRLLATETAAALRRRVVGNELRVEHAVQAIAVFGEAVADGVVQFADDEDLAASVLMLAPRLDRKLPDCMYLALAQREGAALATADRAFSRLAEQNPLVFPVSSAW